MQIHPTALAGVHTVDAIPQKDDRGSFMRLWDPSFAKKHGLQEHFDYTCISTNDKKHTLRGMHYQKDPHGEVKLVTCIKGSIFDVVIDLRPNSKTFKQWIGETLSADDHRSLYIPEGCAHGFLTLEDDTDVLYHIANDFVPEAATGVRFDDPAFGINWPGAPSVISDRDASYPDFSA